jgi:hypothetical protein
MVLLIMGLSAFASEEAALAQRRLANLDFDILSTSR